MSTLPPFQMPSTTEDSQGFRYDAFISYRHVEPDRTWAMWLHASLETYRMPRRLAAARGIPRRLQRVFRDEEELSASADLKAEIAQALGESRYLIVICSPRAPGSLWVNKEVEQFRELGRSDRILALLIEGEPADSFPHALREIRRRITDSQGLTREEVQEVEPLAADVRPAPGSSAGHTRRQAKLRILANILGVHFDDLRQRERSRRHFRQMVGAVSSVLVIIVLATILSLSLRGRSLRQAGELARRFDVAMTSNDWSRQQVDSLDTLLAQWNHLAPVDASAARSRLNRAIAADIEERMHRAYLQASDIEQIRGELALLAERDSALEKPLSVAFQQRTRAWEPIVELKPPFNDLGKCIWSSRLARIPGDPSAIGFQPTRSGDRFTRFIGSRKSMGSSARVMLALADSWEDAPGESAIAFTKAIKDPGQDERYPPAGGYELVLRVRVRTDANDIAAMSQARPADGVVEQEILRDGKVVRHRTFSARSFRAGPLRLSATRDGDRIEFQINDLPPLELVEIFPIQDQEAGCVGLTVNSMQRITELSVLHQTMAARPNPQEAADAAFLRGDFVEALAGYQAAVRTEKQAQFRQGAQYKQALCLLKLGRATEAFGILEPLANEPGDRWPAAAGCHLWSLYDANGRHEDAAAMLDLLHARYTVEQLATVSSNEMRDSLQKLYDSSTRDFGLLNRPRPDQITRLLDLQREEDVFDATPLQQFNARMSLARAYESTENYDAAVAVLDGMLDNRNLSTKLPLERLIMDYSCLMRMRHRPEQALQRLNEVFGSSGDILLLERARLHRDMKRPEEAERDLNAVLSITKTARIVALANLMLGFLREDKGDAKGAAEAWNAGLRAGRQARVAEAHENGWYWEAGMNGAVTVLTVGCLAKISEGDVQQIVNEISSRFMNAPGLAMVQRSAPHVPAAAVLEVFQEARGHDWARRFAFREQPLPQLAIQFARLCVEQFFLNGSLRAPSAGQRAIYQAAAERLVDAYQDGHFQNTQLVQLVLTWKGSSGLFGWKGVAPSLDPPLRGASAYVVGMRFIRLGKDEAACDFFREARDYAKEDATLTQLANAELARCAARPAAAQPHTDPPPVP